MNVLVTGASSGIGNAFVRYLNDKGINIIALDIKDIEEKVFKKFIVDISDSDKLNQIFIQLKEEGIVLDAIVNIAGMFIIDSFIEVKDEELKRIFDVNVMGTINVNKIFFNLLKEKGRIIITSSEVAPLDPLPFNGIYSVTKKTIDAYGQALRQELNVLGYKVITIRPGAFDTKLSRGSLEKTKELMDKTIMYKNQSTRFYDLVRKFMGRPKNVNKVCSVYYKALTKKRPKLIYKKNTNKLLKLLSILPIRLQCYIIKKILK